MVNAFCTRELRTELDPEASRHYAVAVDTAGASGGALGESQDREQRCSAEELPGQEDHEGLGASGRAMRWVAAAVRSLACVSCISHFFCFLEERESSLPLTEGPGWYPPKCWGGPGAGFRPGGA
jgi:hypothetical protein